MTDTTPSDPVPAWAHRTGLLALGPALPAKGDAGALDRHLICERIARYCWAYDERQEDLLADCFTEDGIWEGNVLGKIPIGPFEGREKVRQWLAGFWPHQHDQRRHMILNTLVEAQDADTATTLSYLLLMGADGTAVKLETTGFYRVHYRKEGETWRIARLTAGFDAPFWPGSIETMSDRGRARHGVAKRT
ncbi:nuclear transport factor 2 family protein [Novosphingobium colocasiae]|uniref:SnoaL-like domain-containing protein n=1 Tax=Novosphingobium colocasiae TaxID=1256513 RepID=A0A918UDI4_9SPHN|nr:nuclear transport factor 2 family protein [Novosphingobium colocasiae]GGY91928.1 hypothetical protein GCM10011614_03290 [Novosphingobium colocasiae]